MTEDKVTIREVYRLNEDTRKEINSRFDVMEHKIEEMTMLYALKSDLTEEISNRQKADKAIVLRVSALERWRWYLAGGFAVISALFLYFAAEIKEVFLRP